MHDYQDSGSRAPRSALTISAAYDIGFVTAYQPQDCQRWSLGRIEVVSTPAEVDIANQHLLRRALLAASASAKTVVVDMSATRFCDSATVDVIMPIGQRLHGRGQELQIVCTEPRVLRVFDVLHVGDHFRIFGTLRDVLAQHPQLDREAA